MGNIEQQRIISRYLSTYGVSSEELERLISSIFKSRYPDLAPGAPGGGTDLGMDILHICSAGTGTVWCITKQDHPISKLRDDAIKILSTFRDWNLGELKTIYLCTCKKLSNKAWLKLRHDILEERARLRDQGVTGFSNLEVMKFDCDCIALDMTAYESLNLEKEWLQKKILAGLGIPDQSLMRLGPGIAGEEETDETFSDIHSEWVEENANWSQLYKEIMGKYSGVVSRDNEATILSVVEDVGRLVGATRAMSFGVREQQIPAIQKKLNTRLWPELLNYVDSDPYLLNFDIRLATCFLHFNLALRNRIFSCSPEQVCKAHIFLVGNAARGRLVRQLIIYKLVNLLLWMNHHLCQFDKVLELRNLAYKLLLGIDGQSFSNEERFLLFNLAWLYIHAIKFGQGDKSYREELAGSFNNALEVLEDGFWRRSLRLMSLLYDRRSTAQWATTREQFFCGFELIKMEEVNTIRKAATFVELHARYLELKGITSLEAYEQKLDHLSRLTKQGIDDARLKVYRLLLELKACFFSPWHKVSKRFLNLEQLIQRESGNLGSVWGPIVKLRMLNLFLFRVLDKRVLNQEALLGQSKILSILLDQREIKVLKTYFGIPEIKIKGEMKGKTDTFERLNDAVRPLIFAGLAQYTNKILSNQSLPVGTLARAASDYIDFLTSANARFADVRVSMVLWDLIRLLEENASKTAIFHYYLARLFYKHFLRDIPKALEHFDHFWHGASDFEKNRTAGDYARALYEHHIYYERDEGGKTSLEKLLRIGKAFLEAGGKGHFLSCYYGLALVLEGSSDEGLTEARLLNDLGMLVGQLGKERNLDEKDGYYYENLVGATVYSTAFHEFLKGSTSYILNALWASLNSPEIYNALATYLLHMRRSNLSAELMLPIKILYDVAIGLGHGEEYYLPKYEFNRVRCDFLEIESMGPPRNQSHFGILVATIDSLHRLSPKFPWARRFLEREVCQYLCKYQDEPVVRQVLNYEHFDHKWGVLRRAVHKGLPKPERMYGKG